MVARGRAAGRRVPARRAPADVRPARRQAMRPRAVGRDRAATDGIAFGRHRPRIHPTAFITVGTYVIGRVTVGARASIWFGAVLRRDLALVRPGQESLIEDVVV